MKKIGGRFLQELRGGEVRKLFMTVVTRCQSLRLKCTKFDFDWGSALDPAGELTALPQTP